MKRILVAGLLVALCIVVAPAMAATLYVDDDGFAADPVDDPDGCDSTTFSAYTHPQDAVNAATPGDTIMVCPGTYGTREAPHSPPHFGPNDWFAPALIVYKDELTIQAVDPDPANTIIESTHTVWSNPVAIQWTTGGTFHPGPSGWDAYYTTPPGITPTVGTAPNTVAIIASGVTINGFTFHRPGALWNTAGVMIGGLHAGDGSNLGSDENIIENCVFSDVWHAVYIWHSSGNQIVDNTVAPLTTGHWAAISTFDGQDDSQVSLGHLSENNFIARNIVANKGIALGAWTPPTWTSNAGSKVCSNTVSQVGVTYAHGPVLIGCNSGGFWQINTDKVLRIKGITYIGDTSLMSSGSTEVYLSAQLVYDGSSDGSGVDVGFTVDGGSLSATTVAGGTASTTTNLMPGIYTIETEVSVCDDCEFTDTDTLTIVQPVTIDIKPGSDPNSINLCRAEVVPVAVLTTELFDATQVDPATVTFAGATPVHWAIEDVDGDGDMDQIFQFEVASLNLDETSLEATLTGSTFEGIPIQGTDAVRILMKGCKEES